MATRRRTTARRASSPAGVIVNARKIYESLHAAQIALEDARKAVEWISANGGEDASVYVIRTDIVKADDLMARARGLVLMRYASDPNADF